MAFHTVVGLSVCSGVAGLERGLQLALVPCGYRCVCHIERDVFAAAVIVAGIQSAALDPSLVWSDVTTFDGNDWRGKVDLVSAGFPCQPWSVMGKRKGTDDERWIWEDVARVVREIRPSIVFLENVPALVTGGGIGIVLGSLAECGFDAQWDLFSAQEIGAPHTRDRWFCLAYQSRGGRARSIFRRALADPERARRERLGARVVGGRGNAHGRNTDRRGSQMVFPPARNDDRAWRRYLSQGACEPGLRRGDYGSTSRIDRLRVLGNGVVPDQAAFAFLSLAERALEDMGEA